VSCGSDVALARPRPHGRSVVQTIVGEIMKPRPTVDATPPSLWQLILTAVAFLVTGFSQLLNRPSTGHRVQGLGSILFGIAFLVLLVFLG
jgi:hypothetical protein